MKTNAMKYFGGVLQKSWRLIFASLLLAVLSPQYAVALSINVAGSDGAVVPGYRWLVEEDATKASIPGVPADGSNLALSFHTSYMPVVAAGNSTDPLRSPAALTLDPLKRYYVSVMPDDGYQMGGAAVAPGQMAVNIVVNKTPIPTAQISIFVFNDNQPINAAPDLPQETGLAGFSITLKEAGGTYGASGGQVTQDAFGNPIGTEYQKNPDGTPVMVAGAPVISVKGSGFIKSGADGTALIKYLPPAKYTIEVIPPAGSGYIQTSTIEGTKGDDAWVKANEPSFFQEFGPPGHHVFVGFVKMALNDRTVLTGSSTISGKVVNMHSARPPNFSFYNGEPIPQCWIGLNELAVAGGRAVFTTPCKADSTFSIPNVAAGAYQLVIWDENLDVVIASHNVTVPTGGAAIDLQEVPVFRWFGRLDSRVFFDANNNGFRDTGEVGIGGQAVNLRFRDGSIYQSQLTDANGDAMFSEVFPFFNWLVAEVDFARFKATGATIVVDAGGPVPPHGGWAMPSWNKLNPQPQTDNGGLPYRTETGPVLLQGIQTFLGQTNVIEWGKNVYAPGENGGITGIVHYAITRAEEDPRFAVAENWEPGIPRVQVNLYRDCNADGIIDKADCTATTGLNTAASVVLADVDNWPFGNFPGAEDIDRNGNGVFDPGDAYKIGTTDSWDDKLPSGCQGEPFVSNGYTTDCYDGLRNFNQVRPAVFDGGYAFGPPAGDAELPAGRYIVESVAPAGYLTEKEEDKNVDFGDAYKPGTLALPPACVGDLHTVPNELALFPGVPSAYAGQQRPLCDRKAVDVVQGKNAAADFFMFTEVPVSGHIVGMILNDLANEFDPNAPTFGEKQAPAWVPVSIRDWSGREISRVYADQWGTFNALVPSTYSVNVPMPSGVAPNMITTCMNDPGPIPDGRGNLVIDPYFSRQYSQFCYTFQYLPGKTTYLDTPVLPVAAFAGPGQFPLDCEFADGTPVIYSVEGVTSTGTSQNGPFVPVPSTTVANQPRLRIVSAGMMEVPNPAYDGTTATPRNILRDFGFGAQGAGSKVSLGGLSLPVISWSNDIIEVRVPRTVGTTNVTTGQLEVTRQIAANNLKTSSLGVTVTVGTPAGTTVRAMLPGSKIQAAIDAANPGDLILVPPGRYDELVIMDKKIRLQGWGALSTTINAAKVPAEKINSWRTLVNIKYANGGASRTFDLVPGQTVGVNVPNNEPNLFNTEEGAGIMVVARTNAFANGTAHARIDGLSITGGDTGGGIFVNGYANYLEISNNKIVANNGLYGGGIRLGHPDLVDANGNVTDSQNNFVSIHNNHIAQNGAETDGAVGGGVAICNGSQNYNVSGNYICGNFSAGNGGGIGHLGWSGGSMIANNTVIFNQTFNQGVNVSGGGIFVGGQPPLNGAGLSPGTGKVTITSNLIQGNQAGAGDGGGIAAQFVNGQDVVRAPNFPSGWFPLTIVNNIVTDNMAGMAGGGISLQDAIYTTIANNTIANNDSTATAGAAFAANSPNQSTAQPAGIVSRASSTLLNSTIGNGNSARPYKVGYSNPLLVNNIVWHNRSFYWTIDNTTTPPSFGLHPSLGAGGEAPVYWDLAVLGTSTPALLNPTFSVLTDTTGYAASNLMVDPAFIAGYVNGQPGQTVQQPEFTTAITTAPAFDEGGNWIDVRFGPLTPSGNYHLNAGSPAINRGTQVQCATPANCQVDIDGQARSNPPDIGADEQQ
ncbi:MAG: hypothetical protein K8H84_12500 [Sulfuricella denitrificans]|nr:hypothetical protein [Sulfuricella denitrificans]